MIFDRTKLAAAGAWPRLCNYRSQLVAVISDCACRMRYFKVALRVHRTHRHAAEIQLLQQLADAALVQMNIEFGGNAVTQVSTAPAHHAIGLEVRAVFHPLRHFAPLGFGQTRLTPRPGPVRQPGQAIRVVSDAPSRVASAGPWHWPAQPTAVNDHPAPWQWPECAAPGWRQPVLTRPPATAKYSNIGAQSSLLTCCLLRAIFLTTCCIESHFAAGSGNPPAV